MDRKGKRVLMDDDDSSKKKRNHGDKSGGSSKKRKNRAVLQFFEEAADSDEEYDESSEDNDFDIDMEDLVPEPRVKTEPGRADDPPMLFPKEELPDEEEFDRMMEARYAPGSSFVRYSEDAFQANRSMGRNPILPSAKEPIIWKVKCAVGREKQLVFSLMHKFVDLRSLGSKLHLISVFCVEHIKGFVFIEAEKLCNLVESCRGITSIYTTRHIVMPTSDVSHLLDKWSKVNGVSAGMWARVKYGIYKGDLAQIVGVADSRKKVTIKLIPRIDLQVLAQKYSGGVSAKKGAIPAPRLISSSELDEFRPLIQSRRDRDTGIIYEVLDSLMFKDGFLYKKVSTDSLNCLGVTPTEDESLKFVPVENHESDDLEWLSQIYGEQKKKPTVQTAPTVQMGKGDGKGDGSSGCKGGGKGEGSSGCKGGGKGEGSSGSSSENSFDMYRLVCFGKKDFGLILGFEKDGYYKIMKEGLNEPTVVSVETKDLKSGPLDAKFTALDKHRRTISVNDTVKILEGPLMGKQGVIKHVYRGTIFIYDENETENGGYFCCRSQMCEKVKLAVDPNSDQAGESSFAEGFMFTPNSPEATEKPERESRANFNRGDRDSVFSVGQTLRIRIGPLKGYICRVIAVRFSDVTVKLDSRHKVLTVKCEHLSEVQGKSSTLPVSEEKESFGTEGGSEGWMSKPGTAAEGDAWNAGGVSAEGSAWPSFSASETPGGSEAPNLNSGWGAASGNDKSVDNDEGGSWSSWGKATAETGSGAGTSDAWGKPPAETGVSDTWGKSPAEIGVSNAWGKTPAATGVSDAWGKTPVETSVSDAWGKTPAETGVSDAWGKVTAETGGSDAWGKEKSMSENAAVSWPTKKIESNESGWNSSGDALDKGKKVAVDQSSSWGNEVAGKNQVDAWQSNTTKNQDSSWNTAAANDKSGDKDQGGVWKGWSKPTVGSGSSDTFGKAAVTNEDTGNNWGQAKSSNDGASAWDKSKKVDGDQSSSWGVASNENNQPDSWGKREATDDGVSWGKKTGTSEGGDEKPIAEDSAWGKPDSGSSWTKPNDKSTDEGSKSWGSGGGDWSKPKSDWAQGGGSGGGEQQRSWNSGGGDWSKPKSDWGQGGNSGGGDQQRSWNSGGGDWNKPKSDWGQGDSGGGGEQPRNWDGSQSSERGRGGGRRGGFRGGRDNYQGGRDNFGRGGYRGGRDNFGRGRGDRGRGDRGRGRGDNFGRGGRSFDRGQSQSWKPENSWGNDSGSKPSWDNDSSNKPSWNSDSGSKPSWDNDSSNKPSWNSDSGSKPTWNSEGGSKPSWNSDSGSKPSWNSEGGSKPSWNSDTGSKRAWNSEGGNKPSWNSDSGSKPAWNSEGGSKPSWNSDSGSKPAWNSEGGSKPAWNSDSGSKPAWNSDSGSKPSWNSDSGTKPAWNSEETGGWQKPVASSGGEETVKKTDAPSSGGWDKELGASSQSAGWGNNLNAGQSSSGGWGQQVQGTDKADGQADAAAATSSWGGGGSWN